MIPVGIAMVLLLEGVLYILLLICDPEVPSHDAVFILELVALWIHIKRRFLRDALVNHVSDTVRQADIRFQDFYLSVDSIQRFLNDKTKTYILFFENLEHFALARFYILNIFGILANPSLTT